MSGEPPRYAALIDLGFGDSGKGLFTDALSRRWPVHTVVRFNGGAQAGHNVVRPDGTHHTFSQFGAGTLVRDVATVLAAPVVVHPTALRLEAEALQRLGIADPWSRLHIDARCRVTTPYHQAAGRLREWSRGAAPHGSCGVGVGETVRHALDHPADVLTYGELAHPARALERLQTIRRTLAAEFAEPPPPTAPASWTAERALLHDDRVAAQWLRDATEVARRAPPTPFERIAVRLRAPGTVLFEGAQGILLDEWHGFHPHTTWSTVGPRPCAQLLVDAGVRESLRCFGLTRTYATRHGAGPLPTEDVALDALAEPHNGTNAWQGRFRRGHPDGVLLRYAAEVVGPLDGLLVSHLDAAGRGLLRWNERYHAEGASIDHLPVGASGDLVHQESLTRCLGQVVPLLEAAPLPAPALLERIASAVRAPVAATSHGPGSEDVEIRLG